MKLTTRQGKFIDNLLMGMGQGEAYERAGYKARGAAARANASRLLTNTNIQKKLQKRRQESAQRVDLSSERLLEEEKAIAFSDIGKLFNSNGALIAPDKLPEQVRRALSLVKVIKKADGSTHYKYRFWDKGKALERLAKYIGMFKDENIIMNFELVRLIIRVLPDERVEELKELIRKHLAGKGK
ncbi:MAG: terminase small subunit [Deltaproteobacteria bacterium]|nr:terminase small subunit [Deltaproteobacteria bacterium]MBW2153929.1 terminase small subunit [Deltaproteobacteria bacterium]